MSLYLSIFNTIYNDAPQPWQLGFQDSAAPGFTGLVTLHNTIGFYLIVICFAVAWALFSTVYFYSSKNNPIAHKYLTHGTVLELIWTITPALILIAIAFPSFRLLYLMDCPICNINFDLLYLNVAPVTKSVSVKNLKSSSTDLVPYGTVGSTTLIRFNNYVRNATPFPIQVISQLVGHLLGDGSIQFSKTSTTPYFIFTQTQKRFKYVWFVYQQLSHYCGRYPLLGVSSRKGNSYYFISVVTRSYSKLLTLFNLFYEVKNGKVVKRINYELLPYLDEIALAYWSMDDGAWTKAGFYLHTKGFTFLEVYQLVAMLHYKFMLVCTVQNHEGRPVIYIKAKSMIHFRGLVTPYFHPSMIYKLKLKQIT
jgi:LAGLIDADG DNA endonuclease family/Cytochrome C oxidase subunit II, transmembrane domain